MREKIFTLVLAVAALLSFSYGITGFATLDDSSGQCILDSDCTYSVCCPLYGTDTGTCAQQSQCAQIYFDSKGDTGNVVSAQAPEVQASTERSYIAVSVGVLLLLILAIIGYLEWKQQAVPRPRKKSRK